MMTTCRDHSDDKVGITTISNFRYYSWFSEHQDYDCNTSPPTKISWKWISFILPRFIYASSGDKQCITLGESLWTMNQFLVTNESQVCKLCVSMFRNKWNGFIQNHLDKPHCAAIEANDASWMWPHSGTLWHNCEDVIFCKNEKYFVQSHIKMYLVTRQSFCSIMYRMW